MDITSTTIEDKLRQAWLRQRRYVHLRGASRFLIWLVAMIALDFAIDWGFFFHIRMTNRLGLLLLAVNVVVLGWVLWREWLRHLKPFDPLRVSLDVEARHPELASLLVSYTQFAGTIEKQPNVSHELIQATRAEAVVQTRRLNFGEIIDFEQLKRLFLVALGVMLLFAAVSIANQDHFRTLLARLAGLDASYPTQTQVIRVSGDMQVRVGDPARVISEAGGVLPVGGQIYIKPADGSGGWKTLPLNKIGVGPKFARELKEVAKDLVYYVRIGDDQSAHHRIHVVAAPQVVAAEIILNYPAYLEQDAGQVDQLSLQVPKGTTIEWHLACDKPVKRLLVKAHRAGSSAKQETVEAKIDASGKNVTFSMLADRGLKYTFHWTERESGSDFEFDDVQHSVRVTADAPPVVELVRPSADGLATVNKTVKLVATAGDDHGLAQAWLVYRVDDNEESHLPIHDFHGVRKQEFRFAWELKKSIKDLKPGVRVSFAVEVVDRNPDAAGRRRSAPRQFSVVEPERYLEWQQGELAVQVDELKQVRDSEVASSVQVEQLKEQEAKAP